MASMLCLILLAITVLLLPTVLIVAGCMRSSQISKGGQTINGKTQ